jgi:Pectinacetylesterase
MRCSPLFAFLFLLLSSFFLLSCEESEESPSDKSALPSGAQAEDPVPIESVDRQVHDWRWIPIEGTMCRGGTETGIGLRLVEGSDKVAIYLQPTGICAFEGQCRDERDHFDEEVFEQVRDEKLYKGLFNAEMSDNPMRDWNLVFVPGCTGDMYVGNNPNGFALGLPFPQRFVGFLNLQKIVAQVRHIFEFDPSRIFIWGECSGGNGTLVLYPLVAKEFEGVPLSLLNDSGPLAASDAALSPCMQKLIRTVFNIAPSIPPGCDVCSLENGDGLSNIQPYLAQTYPDGVFGLMSFKADLAIRLAWGFGQDSCLRYFFADDEDDLLIPEQVFRESLYDLRDNHLQPTGRWSTFFTKGEMHTFGLENNWLYEKEEGLIVLDWIRDLAEGRLPDPEEFFEPLL